MQTALISYQLTGKPEFILLMKKLQSFGLSFCFLPQACLQEPEMSKFSRCGYHQGWTYQVPSDSQSHVITFSANINAHFIPNAVIYPTVSTCVVFCASSGQFSI